MKQWLMTIIILMTPYAFSAELTDDLSDDLPKPFVLSKLSPVHQKFWTDEKMAIHQSIINLDLNKVKELLTTNKKQVEILDAGLSPLMRALRDACYAKSRPGREILEQIALELLQHGADINAVRKLNWEQGKSSLLAVVTEGVPESMAYIVSFFIRENIPLKKDNLQFLSDRKLIITRKRKTKR
jgi:hypothetical protein